MTRTHLPVGSSALVLGLLIALAGSFADNLLGDAPVVTVLQLVLWSTGGILVLAGAASSVTMRTSQRAKRVGRPRSGLRPT